MAKLEITKLVAERIRNWRERSGKSLDEVVAATGLAREVLEGYEGGKRSVPLGVLKVLSEIYRADPLEVAGFLNDDELPHSLPKVNGSK